jgi:hypothetical protein
MKAIPVPTIHIYEFECNQDLIERAFQDFKNHPIYWIKNGEVPEGTTSYGYLGPKLTPWYHEDLFNWMQDCLDQVAKSTIKLPLSICDSWGTKTEFLQTDLRHKHAYSVFSGLLYFTDHTASTTVFSYLDHTHEKFSHIFPIEKSLGTLEFIPKKGKLLIFPSDIFHNIQVHTELKNIRYSLSFNSFFSGTLSNNSTGGLHTKVIGIKEKYSKWKEDNGIN